MITSTKGNDMKNSNADIFNNQEQLFIHARLKSDLAYAYSVEHADVRNMQMVLRAYGFPFSIDAAALQLEVAS